MDMDAVQDLATAADAAGNFSPSLIIKALSCNRERLFCSLTYALYLLSGHIFPVDTDPDIYTY